MAVYVDDMRAPFGRMIMCHMIADTSEELHAMADRIGVARRWCQYPGIPHREHYDIALSKRQLAVQCGAVEITWRETGIRTVLARPGLPDAERATYQRMLDAAIAERTMLMGAP